jgi:hypothetical protein
MYEPPLGPSLPPLDPLPEGPRVRPGVHDLGSLLATVVFAVLVLFMCAAFVLLSNGLAR